MAKAKVQKKYSVSAEGELNITEDGVATITNMETGEVFVLTDVLADFVEREVKISCNYAEDIESPEDLQ